MPQKSDRKSCEVAGKPEIAVFTGAGVSADSGLSTFRDHNGLWANYRIEDVCTPEALERNRSAVIDFYNMRRRELLLTKPNAGHLTLAALEKDYNIHIVTQNIDDLHERAGSTAVLHLHGELRKLRSSNNPEFVIPVEGWEQDPERRAPDGSLLRPYVVFFGEAVPMFEPACEIVSTADLLIVAGTSLAVYPAASLLRYVKSGARVILIDPGEPDTSWINNPVTVIKKRFVEGMDDAAAILWDMYRD